MTIGIKGDVAQQRGLYTCGSVWACPVCSAKILTERSHEIAEAIKRWESQGKFFVFQTLTLSHRSGDSVAKQRSLLKVAWAAITKGSFRAKHLAFGQVGYFRVAEITTGENGEHLHLHLLRFIDRWLTPEELQDWGKSIFEKWSNALVAEGSRKPSMSGYDFQQLSRASELSGYFTKGFDNPIHEPIHGPVSPKRGRNIWRLLDDALENPLSDPANNWRAYERDTLGMKQITWSSGFRRLLGIVEEKTDDELARDETEFVPIVQIEPDSVQRLGALGQVHSRILHHIECGDVETALQLLAEHGVGYRLLVAGLKVAHVNSP